LKDPFSIRTEKPIAHMVMRDRFDQLLVQKGIEKGIDFLEGRKVVQVLTQGDQMEVRSAQGDLFRCSHLIGADGPESLVAKAASLQPLKGNGKGIAVEGEISFPVAAFPREDETLVHLDFGGVPNGYSWVFPKKDGLSVGIGGMFQPGKRMNPRQYYERFASNLPYFEREKAGQIMGHTLPAYYGEGQKVSAGRVLLVGDAAHLMDPLMGEGIYYAIRSGMLAAEAVLRTEQTGDAPSEAYQALIERHLFGNLRWALYFSKFVFRFDKLAYQTLKRYPEIADHYLRVLEGTETYQGFVQEMKERIQNFFGGRLTEKIRKAMRNL
jgi:geranylgeranyl reductase family protein